MKKIKDIVVFAWEGYSLLPGYNARQLDKPFHFKFYTSHIRDYSCTT